MGRLVFPGLDTVPTQKCVEGDVRCLYMVFETGFRSSRLRIYLAHELPDE